MLLDLQVLFNHHLDLFYLLFGEDPVEDAILRFVLLIDVDKLLLLLGTNLLYALVDGRHARLNRSAGLLVPDIQIAVVPSKALRSALIRLSGQAITRLKVRDLELISKGLVNLIDA